MNFVIARTRPEVGRLLTSADGIKFCKIISHGVKTAYFCLLLLSAKACERQMGVTRKISY